MSRLRPAMLGAVLALVVAACGTEPSASPTPTDAVPSATPAATPAPTATAVATAEPTPTAEPPLSLDLPSETDPRVVAVEVAPAIDGERGTVTVTVTSASDERIDEIVLRWPVELEASLRLAPFSPSDDRIRDGGPPLVQPWTKWVVGPGEEGEPDGTISVGWGPLLPGATLEIPLVATRAADGPIAFDLQVLAENALLQFEGDEPAELRVEVP